MRQLEGKVLTVPVVDEINPASDPASIGVSLLDMADGTASFARVRPRTMGVYVPLTGGTSIELVCYVFITTPDGDLGWARASDTGNFGVLGGGAIPSDDSYVFLLNFAGIYKALVIVAQNNIGAVVVGAVKLIEYAEYVLPK